MFKTDDEILSGFCCQAEKREDFYFIEKQQEAVIPKKKSGRTAAQQIGREFSGILFYNKNKEFSALRKRNLASRNSICYNEAYG